MPIQPMTFRALSPQEVGGVDGLQSLSAGQQLINNLLSQRLSRLQGDELKAKMPYIAPTAEAELQHQLLTNEWLPKLNQSTIGLQGAEARHYNVLSDYTPMDKLTEAYKALNSSNRFGASYELSRWLNLQDPASRAAWIANNSEKYNQMVKDLTDAVDAHNQNVNPFYTALSNEVNKLYPGSIPAPQATGAPANAPAAVNAPANAPAGATQSPAVNQDVLQNPAILQDQLQKLYSGMNINPPSSILDNSSPYMQPFQQPEQPAQAAPQQAPQEAAVPQMQTPTPATDIDPVESIKLNNSLVANRKNSTQFTNQRVEGAVTLHKTMNKLLSEPDPSDPRGITGAQRLINATKYAGQVGAARRHTEALLPPYLQSQEYKDWYWATHVFKPTVSNVVKNMEKLSIQPSQRKEIHDMIAPFDTLDLGSKDAMTMMDSTLSALQKAGEAIIETGEPVQKGIYKRLYGLKDLGTPLKDAQAGGDKSNYVKMTDGTRNYYVHPEDVKEAEANNWKKI